MELNKENMRKIRKLILFTALLIVVLWKYEEVLEVLGYVGHLIFPFLLGGAIAFVLNVPMNFIERHLFMEKVRKKLIREKAVIAVYQYLLTNSTEEEIMNYLNECYKPRMDEREIELCKEIVFNTIERIDEYVPLIEKNLKKSWSIDRLSMMEKAILYVAIYERNEVSKEISINQAVELAKKYCDEDAYKFINGVLGAIG